MTRNLSHKKLLLVEENQKITANDIEGTTQVDIKVRVVSNTSFTPIRGRIEGWGLSRFRQNTMNVSKNS